MKWHDKGDRLIVETASTIKCNLLEVDFLERLRATINKRLIYRLSSVFGQASHQISIEFVI
ncbi:MAG: hypothetical protein Q8N35_09675 [Methylococcaceae bacterium]|nr:hypothetical protein [Methylococcaceae bacterium]MDZ4156244.1 hypothetical protein [Methylococcales bacterium]MDP2393822.1 hypothetical protein [Methylococcaceae bacterium]MDP3019848.1 hypothetical protein [Methylococcaceae bacterium]MDP3389547.1 hypothetical protein [Methylococcaceae bacterium]